MATTFHYIKALIAIRLFNGALWMEEEDIARIPAAQFNSLEVQTAISNAELIEVNSNDLPVDVTSPHLKLRGDWDPSNGQLPIGRRIGDTYKILEPGGTVGSTKLLPGARVIFTSLMEFEVLGTGAIDPNDLVSKLVDLKDVDITDLADGTSPVYRASDQKFEFKEISAGYVLITDISPTSILQNVFNKVTTDDGFVLQSCYSSTRNITVTVTANSGKSSFKPSVTVDGVPAVLTRLSVSDLWQGTANLTLTGTGPFTVVATRSDGGTDSAEVTLEEGPTITSLEFSNAYSQGIGQVEHAAGQTLNLNVSADQPFNSIEVVSDLSNAIQVQTYPVTLSTSNTILVLAENRGLTSTAYAAKVRVRNVNGTWSDIYSSNTTGSTDGVNVITLNNTYPVVSFTGVVYPVGQQALKGTEQATVQVIEQNVSTVSYTSSQLSITDPTSLGNKVVSRSSGSYNDSTNNLHVTTTRTANATSASFDTLVNIADVEPAITITTPIARLRSSASGLKSYVITLTSSQRTVSLNLSATVGTFVGSWQTTDGGLHWTRTLNISESDIKGTAFWTGLALTNLSGIVKTVIDVGQDDYIVGGFESRTIFVSPWVNGSSAVEREAPIGTNVLDTSKLLTVVGATPGTYTNSLVPYTSPNSSPTTDYAITGPSGTLNALGDIVYVRDTRLASGNLTGTLSVTIEESV